MNDRHTLATTRPIRIFRLLPALILMSVPMAGATQTANAVDNAPSMFSLYLENDLFSGSDRYYTNGIKLSWISPDLAHFSDHASVPNWLGRLAERAPFFSDEDNRRNVTFSIGQNIYTPEDTETQELIEDDRPYAGITYLGWGLHNKTLTSFESLSLILGMVGPSSFADRTQKVIHDIIGSKQPQGWDNQLEDEPVVNIAFERRCRYRRSLGELIDIDLIPFAGLAAGTILTGADAGVELRFGRHIPDDYGLCLIRSGCNHDAMRSRRSAFQEQIGFYFLLAVNGQAVLRNIFLDGNTFRDSHSVDKKNFVAEAGGGFGISYGRFMLGFTYMSRTKEFEGQEKSQEYGSVTLSVIY